MVGKKPKPSPSATLDSALKAIREMPAPEQVKNPCPESLLVVYEMLPEETHLYFIPQPELLHKNLLGALRMLENITINCCELTEKQDKAFQYVNAAMCKTPDHLDDSNPHNCNRFAHALVPFQVERSQTSQPCFPILNGRALRIIRSGFAM